MAKKNTAATAAAAAADGGEAKTTPSRRRRKLSTAGDDEPAAAAGDSPAAAVKASPRKRTKTEKSVKAAAAAAAAADDEDDVGAAADAAADKPKAAKPKPKRKSKADPAPAGPIYDTSMRPPRFDGPAHRFLSWNVAGMRALMKKDAEAVQRLVEAEQVDALCLQETKLQESHVEEIVQQLGLDGWHVTFNCSTAKKGYSGTATLCRQEPLSVQCGIGDVQHDDEGRVVTVELPELWLVNVYTPNSGAELKRLDYRTQQWDKALTSYIQGLHSGAGGKAAKPVVVVGDLNCAREPIDTYGDPKKFSKYAGFTPEERASFEAELLVRGGMVDAWREKYPGVVGYTYYGYRGPNGGMRAQGKGWRLDYTLVSESLAPHVHDCFILKDITGSDHVPLGIVIKKAAA